MKRTFTFIASICAFCLINVSAIAMPVQFYSVDAEVVNGTVLVQWSTISETSNLHFVVQRSPNGHDWTDLGIVDGSVNSSTLVEYSFTDNDVFTHGIYYRIKQIDFTGTASFSNEVSIGKPNVYFDTVKSYPNPATNEIKVPLDQAPLGTKVSVLNSLGFEVISKEMIEPGLEVIDLSSLTKGFYYLKLEYKGTESIQRFFKS